ncbi:CHAT domain-containing protein [Streptomyces griseorubiginosus]|uniref:CHAT domain-containing protein n=1 Tax=Streptomyces griseorubiginosus TaxID=67304 RepID=UPI0036EAFD16
MEQDFLADMEARLQRFRTSGDPAHLLDELAQGEATALAALLHADADRRCHFTLGLFHWYRSRLLPWRDAMENAAKAHDLLWPCYVAGREDLPASVVPVLAARALRSVTGRLEETIAGSAGPPPSELVSLWARSLELAAPGAREETIARVLPAGGTYTPEQLDLLIDVGRAIVKATPRGHDLEAPGLSVLASCLIERFHANNSTADLEAADEAFRTARGITPPDHPMAAQLEHQRRQTRRLRLAHMAGKTELDEAVRAARDALAADGSALDRQSRLYDLATALNSRYQRFRSDIDLQDAINAFQELNDRAPVDHPDVLRSDEISSLAELLSARHQLHQRLPDLDKLIDTLTALVHIVHITSPLYVPSLRHLVTVMAGRSEITGRPRDLDAAITLLETIERDLPANAPPTADVLLLHGRILQTRASRLALPADLDKAIELYGSAATASAPGRTVRLDALKHLGAALGQRAQWSGSRPDDMDKAVATAQKAVDEAPLNHPLRPSLLHDLAGAHHLRHNLTRSTADLDAEIRINRLLLDAGGTEDPEYPLHARNLGIALLLRSEAVNDPSDANEAVDVLSAALQCAEEGSPQVGVLEHILRGAYRWRFTFTRDWRDAWAGATATKGNPSPDESSADRLFMQSDSWPHSPYPVLVDGLGVAHTETPGWNEGLIPFLTQMGAALDNVPPGTPGWLYAQRFRQVLRESPAALGSLAGVEELTNAYRAVLQPINLPTTTAGHLQYDASLEALRHELRDPGARPYGALRVQTLIDAQHKALEEPEPSVPARYTHQLLACALLTTYERSGDLHELDAAVRAMRTALAATPFNNPERAAQHCFLADALWQRYECTGEQEDLTGVITSLRHLSKLLPRGGCGQCRRCRLRGRLHFNLACALRRVFEQTGREEDGATALLQVYLARAYVLPGHPDCDLYGALINWWTPDSAQSTEDLKELIRAYRAVIDDMPEGDADRTVCQSSLGELLRLLHLRTQDSTTLDAAIEATQCAVAGTVVPRAAHACDLTRLAALLLQRHQQERDEADREAAIQAYTQGVAVPAAPPSLRIHAAQSAAALCAPDRPKDAAQLLTNAMRLLPDTAPQHRPRALQESALSAFPGLVADAAALTLRTADADTQEPPAYQALTLLESGRAVLIGQALEVRGDIALLRHHHPQLAHHFVELRAALHLPDGEGEVEEEATSSPTRASQHSRRLTEELTEVLQEIRRQPGFASFGRPPTLRQLTAQAAQGPIVVYNMSDYRSDALIITEDGITSLALPTLTPHAVRQQVRAFQQALRHAADPQLRPVDRKDAQGRMRTVLAWLWDNAAGPVLHHLGIASAHRSSAPWPRVWWIPGGLLGQLPLHAAGHHDEALDAPDRRTVLDRVVSSFSPSVRALDHSRTRDRSQHRPLDKALIISMPTTPGMNAPLRADEEARVLKSRLPSSLRLTDATSAEVMEHLSDYPIVHFACHAVCHPTHPSQSTLLLTDHASAPMTVQRLNTLHLGQGRLAYLSACSTAVTAADTLLDEAIHLTSAFQLAGFPHVIGTLWQVDDTTALQVATAFYGHLAESGLQSGDMALALHKAQRDRRDAYPALVSRWAAHLHTGA